MSQLVDFFELIISISLDIKAISTAEKSKPLGKNSAKCLQALIFPVIYNFIYLPYIYIKSMIYTIYQFYITFMNFLAFFYSIIQVRLHFCK